MSATSLLLAQLEHAAANRSPGKSPPRRPDARDAEGKRRAHVSRWETAGEVHPPRKEEVVAGGMALRRSPRGKGRAREASAAVEDWTAKKRKVQQKGEVDGEAKSRAKATDVLVLGSSDVEAESGAGDAEESDELDEWGMPPSGQGR